MARRSRLQGTGPGTTAGARNHEATAGNTVRLDVRSCARLEAIRRFMGGGVAVLSAEAALRAVLLHYSLDLGLEDATGPRRYRDILERMVGDSTILDIAAVLVTGDERARRSALERLARKCPDSRDVQRLRETVCAGVSMDSALDAPVERIVSGSGGPP